MNKKTLFTSCLVLCITVCNAQQSFLYRLVSEKRNHVKPTGTTILFSKNPGALNARINETITEKTILDLDREATARIFDQRPATISLQIPFSTGTNFQLELIQQDINSMGEFSFGTISGNGIKEKIGTEQGLHYRGYINADPASIASFSIFANGEVMGLFSNESGNFNIGKLQDNSGEYVLYNSKYMKASLGFECATSEIPVVPTDMPNLRVDDIPLPGAIPSLLCKKVRLYWEADYKLFSNNFSSNLVNTTNYLTGLFNQVSVMYQNEGILIELSDTYFWITADPYNTSTSSNGLATFKSRWNGLGNNFKADLAMLIDGAPTNNGGVAYLLTNNLCNRTYAYGYADVYASYNTVPVYSWDVEVVTHELGHMVGSNHTHWCGWNTGAGGTCGAIDDCYAVETTTLCSSCSATTATNPTAPSGFKGTVMSYCHLRSGIGINLANGFGPLPQAVIRNTVNNASCALYDNKWTGTESTAWENPANWGCGTIPDATTDVTISSSLTNYPEIRSAATCRRIKQETATSVIVRPGFSLILTGVSN